MPNALDHVQLDIGVCIYCGRSDVELSDEHIIPLSMGGLDVLERASCATCAKAINRYEHRLGKHFLATRAVLGLPTRNRKSRPTSFMTKVKRNGIWREEMVPTNLYPAGMAWPVFLPPTVLDGRIETGFRFRQVRHIGVNNVEADPGLVEALKANGIEAIDSTFTLEPYALARELLKIAYGYAVSVYGVDGIDPWTLPCILNESDAVYRFVGCMPERRPEESTTGLHSAWIHVRDEDQLLFAVIRLFTGILGDRVPEYVAIVGRLRVHEIDASLATA